MLFQKHSLSKLLSIFCALLIVALFVLQCFPYWSFEEKTIHVYSDAHDDDEFKGFSTPIVSDAEQPNREAFTLAATNDSINSLAWFPVKHKDTRMHLHLALGDQLKSQNGQKLEIGRSGNQTIARSKYVSFLVAAFDITSPEGNNGTENFADIKEDADYIEQLLIARNAGIVDIPEDNTFRPNEPMTRSDAMLVLYRILTILESEDFDFGTLDLSAKADIKPAEEYEDFETVPEEAKEAVSTLMNAGIIQPYEKVEKITDENGEKVEKRTLLVGPEENINPKDISSLFKSYFPDRYGKLAGGSLVSPHEVSPLDDDDNFEPNGLALAVIVQQVFGLIMLILLASKPNTFLPALLAFFHGVWGILGGYVFCPALKLGDTFMVHISISAAVLAVSIIAMILHFVSKKNKSKVK